MLKLTTFVALAVVLPGCLTLTNARDTPGVICAASGQYPDGVTSIKWRDGQNTRMISCRPPKSEAQRCAMNAHREIGEAGDEHDAAWKLKRIAVGVGYVLYVIPGAAMYYLWKDENEASYSVFRDKVDKAISKCEPKDAVAH